MFRVNKNGIFTDITKYRSSLMGIAMLSVFLFHSMGDWMPTMICNIAANGAIGVDVFLFLSSIGLTYSITKNPSVTAFYKRRVLRIMPTYWFIMTCVYLFVFILTAVHTMPDNYYRIHRNFGEFIQAYTTIGYWIRDGLFYLWYIPAILLLYILFPFVHKLFVISKWTYLLCLIPGSILTFFPPDIAWYHNCLLYRVGIFMFGGIFSIEYLQRVRTFKAWKIYVVGASAFVFYIIRMQLGIATFPRLVEEVCFFATLPCILICLTLLFRYKIIDLSMGFVGKISLEFYLIHEFVMRFMETISNVIVKMSPLVQKLMTLVITLILAYIVHIIISKVVGIFTKCKKIAV